MVRLLPDTQAHSSGPDHPFGGCRERTDLTPGGQLDLSALTGTLLCCMGWRCFGPIGQRSSARGRGGSGYGRATTYPGHAVHVPGSRGLRGRRVTRRSTGVSLEWLPVPRLHARTRRVRYAVAVRIYIARIHESLAYRDSCARGSFVWG